jgi:alpha-L-rhamnosidase
MVRNETGWMVYGVPLFGFRFTLAADNDVVGPPNTLRITEPFSAGTVLQASRKAESKLSEERTKQNNVVRTVLKINIALM